MGTKRELTAEQLQLRVEVLAKLRANDGNAKKTADETGIPRRTIGYWEQQNRKAAATVRKEQSQDGTLAEKQQRVIAEGVETVHALVVENLESLAAELVDEMRIAMNGAPFSALGINFGIVFDKAQVMKGKPTSINQTIGNMPEEERAKRAAELINRGRLRRLNGGGQAMALLEEPAQDNGTSNT